MTEEHRDLNSPTEHWFTWLVQAGVLTKGWGDLPEGVKFEQPFELRSIRYRHGTGTGEYSVGLFTRPAVTGARFEIQRGPSTHLPGTAARVRTGVEVLLTGCWYIPPHTFMRCKVLKCHGVARRLYVDVEGRFIPLPEDGSE
jgi:hypothetical protein